MTKLRLSAYSKTVQFAAHAIGMDNRNVYKRHGRLFYRPYRNYFTTPPEGDCYELWMYLVGEDYAERRPTQRGGFSFSLTRSGLDWLEAVLGVRIYDEED